MQHLRRQAQRRVAVIAKFHETRLGRIAADVDVVRPVLGHRRLAGRVLAGLRAVVMPDEQPRVVGQRQDRLDRLP